ncbi:transcriptional protein SWT1 isoform X2 [Odontomachus brunneus]|uniref:transcriptional protein SWT1 isoform X2 n=1 Tax=Odontomachus brunneus TaxID=486640 RepID=UPI0013F196AF|nr:transcriptional protein SWT1 isoform X2 [Odontomachus brunneus]
MKKCKLPENWIIVNSKSHPDRVYYFNVKTNQSSWREPTLEQANDKSSEHISKRRKHHHKEEGTRAKTPEHDFIENKRSHKQQLLSNKKSSKMVGKTEGIRSNQRNRNLAQERMQILRKSLNHEMQKQKNNCSTIVKKHSEKLHKSLPVSRSEKNDTPPMKALRELLAQRKLEKPAIRNRSSGKNQEHNSVSTFVKKSLEQTENNKPIVSSSKKPCLEGTDDSVIILPSQSTSPAFSGNNKAPSGENKTTFTPQMRAIHEKIQKRSGILVVDKKTKNKHDIKQKRRNQPNKNIAQDRMQKLRNSLNHEMQKCEDDCSIIADIRLERLNKSLPVSSYNKNIESISIRRNADIRLKRLHNRILKETVYERKEQANQEVLYEEMDWEPMKDEEITLEVEDIRAQLNNKNCANVSNCSLENTTVLTQPLESQEKGPLYIVIDTNVFLTNLEIIEEARDATFKNYPRPFIVIPWTVIRELDYLKNDKSRSETLCTKARKAISFINKHFASKHPRIVGQTREQAATNKENFCIDCPDDEILQCCLQIKNLKKDAVLLSYDKNLCTKAMIHRIMTVGRDDPLAKLDNLNTSDKIMNPLSNNAQHSILSEELHFSDKFFEDAKMIMKDLFSTIVVKQMSEIYGPEWETYVIIKPPWNIVTVLKCIIKHWIAAINESFHRYAELTTRELLEIFDHLPVGGRKLQDVEYTLEKCSDLIQAINEDKHYDLMVQSFNAITEIKTKCLKCITDIDRKKLHDKIGIIEDVQQQDQSAEKVLQCFKYIYSYARDFCGLAASIAGKVFPLNYSPINPPLSHATVKRLQADIAKKVNDLSHNLNKLLVQAENNSIKYQTLSTLQQDLNAFFAYIEVTTMNVELLDIFYCIILKKEVLKVGLRQLQELGTHYRALYLNVCNRII